MIGDVPYTLTFTYFDIGYGSNPNDISIVYAMTTRILINNEWGYFSLIIAPHSSIYTLVVAGLGEQAKRVVYASAALSG